MLLMSLSKAIEIGEDILRYVKPGDLSEENDAIKLLIEAGKRVNSTRGQISPKFIKLLPGETKE